ncbi:MAG: cobalamin biosynthesis protein, partial [Hyphomicrobiales bacterium]
MVTGPAIIGLSASGCETARRIAAGLGGCEVHGLRGRCDGADVPFEDTMSHLRGLFAADRPIVGICAAGILIRALGPVLADKRNEPPVIAVAGDGSAVVPLLGGHHGANRLAGEIADALGVTAALTTAGDARFGVALDDPPAGWTLANPVDAKKVMAGLLAGGNVRLDGDAPWLAALPLSGDAETELIVTEKALPGTDRRLVYHPATLALGVGCERHCPPDEVVDLVEGVLTEHGLAPQAIALVGSIDLKADEAAVNAVAQRLGVPLRVFAADALNDVADRLENPSDLVMREVGCPGVAEGAALVAAGPEAELVVAKTKSRRATCAIARAPGPIDTQSVGRARGRLSVVGLGPGSRDWRSPEASRLLSQAGDWVGYGLYLDLTQDLNRGKTEHRFDLGQEEARVRHALELAGEGKDVALICS